MKVIYNNVIPFKGFAAMNFMGLILFVRKGVRLTEKTLNHENIHSKQWMETLYIGFLIIYCLEYVINLLRQIGGSNSFSNKLHTAYRMISFECEAYANESDADYLKTRKRFAWTEYL